MLDCSGCTGIDSRDNIYNFVKELVPAIKMEAFGEPVIEYLLPGDPKQGYSFTQLITTSHICAHFMELDGTAYFDIFSCRAFDLDIARGIVVKYFNPAKIRVNYLTRHAD